MQTENIILPPTQEIEKVCDLPEQLIRQILEAQDTLPSPGEYESNDETFLLLVLMIRNVEAITTLAKKDLVLLPSAMNLTRSVFETAMKALWMLQPPDAFDREARWFAQLQTEESYYDRIAKRLSDLKIDNSDVIKIRDNISGFRLDVIDVLPKQYKPLSKIPKMEEMLADINEKQRYATYILLSQYSHGTHVATGLYRKGLGNKKEFGEFITPKQWGIIFSICWYCLAKTSERIFEVLGGNVNKFLTNEFILEIQEVIQKIETS